MPIKHYTQHTYEHYEREHDTEHTFPLPFDTEGNLEHVYLAANGLKAVLAFLVRDDSPADPIEEFDIGEFYQFNPHYIHSTNRPSIDSWKRIIRDNPGRVMTIRSAGDGYAVDSGPFTVKDTRGAEDSPAEQALDDADGYYVCPEDATDPARYATAVLSEYSAFCEGDVYGVIVWEYTRESIAEPWGEPDRDAECRGFYGYKYALEELTEQYRYTCFKNDPSKENAQP